MEIFDGKNLVPGTCVLISSLSYLGRVGVAAYASEWRVCVDMLASRWGGILICPLFPILLSEIPGNLFSELVILHTWFKKVYAGTNQGLSSSWERFVETLLEFSEGAGSLDYPDRRPVLLPSSLDPRGNFENIYFSTSSTNPSVIFAFEKASIYQLLLSLTVSLRRGFSLTANPEGILAREPAVASEGAKETKNVQTIILAGASNLASLKPIFEANGAKVIDLTKPGWMVSEKNVESLRSEIAAVVGMEDTAIIFDLFGNSTYKFKHVDGTLVLPMHMGGGYHLLGDILLDNDRKNGELIELVKPLFSLAKDFLCVIMPPSPRYVYSGCCADPSHSTNVREEGYPAQTLESVLHFRKLLKTSLVGSEGMGTFWVTDTLACLGTIPASMQEKLSALRTAMGNDGVHFSVQGRYNLFTNLAKTIYGLKNGSIGKPPNKAEAAASVVSGRKYYWRGFLSERGSTLRPQPYKRGGSAGRGRGRGNDRSRATPYDKPANMGPGRGARGGRGGSSRGFF
jgi:hypothetical protein